MYIYIYIYIYIIVYCTYIYISWLIIVEDDPTKASFSIAITLRCKEGCCSFLWVAPLTLDPYLIMVLSKKTSSTIFWVFGMAWPGIEPRSPGPLVNTLTIKSMACQYFFFIIQCVKACAILCPHQPPARGDNTVSVAQGGTATPGTANQGDNTVSVAQSGTATPGTTKQLTPGVAVPPWATETVLPPWLAADEDRVLHVLSHVVWWKKKNLLDHWWTL